MKTPELSPDEERLVRIFRALGNPMRFRILQTLHERQACVCGEIVDLLPLAQSSVSEHLKVLREAGLVRGVIEGPATCYCTDPDTLRWLQRETIQRFAGHGDITAWNAVRSLERRNPVENTALTPGDAIKEAVSAHYGARASQHLAALATAPTGQPLALLPLAQDDACCATDSGACCTTAESCGPGYSAEDLAGLPAGVTGLTLGCGAPVGLADVHPGETVLDLGSGGGIDCFLAARRVGPEGRVIGVDMTPEMVRLARANAVEAGAANVEFRLGEIEHLPVETSTVDLVISNCVINLAPDKDAVFREAARALRPGGRMVVADIATDRPVPDELRERMDLWSACTSGALDRADYLARLHAAGFAAVELLEEREVERLGETGPVVLSLTVRAVKPA